MESEKPEVSKEEVAEVATSSVVESTTKDVEIDITINDHRYNGIVSISRDECHDINLHNLLDDYSLYATKGGRNVIKVCHILAGTALHLAGEGFDDDIVECCETHWFVDKEFCVNLRNDDYCLRDLAYYFDDWDSWYALSETEERYVRDHGSGYIHSYRAPAEWFRDRYFCRRCDCYMMDDDDYMSDEDECRFCWRDHQPKIIEGYWESHEHTPILFGDYKNEGSFVGLGFELEVDCDEDLQNENDEVAWGLCEACGLEKNEMRFAKDGSLDYGFECISQPHTIKDFWMKQDKWRKMLKYLANAGYRSHDPGTCGLHVHVSRAMFGKIKSVQEAAIAKVYTFFDDNWEDIIKISRRRSTDYCNKNILYSEEYEQVSEGKTTKYECWKKKAKFEGGHHVALNNSNRDTFEYRLGRGTLNAWSFFSWIDFVLTITKNAKRITVEKVESNDILSWLGGITESTAKYIYKRGAFQKEMLALYPSIEWEQDLIDNN